MAFAEKALLIWQSNGQHESAVGRGTAAKAILFLCCHSIAPAGHQFRRWPHISALGSWIFWGLRWWSQTCEFSKLTMDTDWTHPLASGHFGTFIHSPR